MEKERALAAHFAQEQLQREVQLSLPQVCHFCKCYGIHQVLWRGPFASVTPSEKDKQTERQSNRKTDLRVALVVVQTLLQLPETVLLWHTGKSLPNFEQFFFIVNKTGVREGEASLDELFFTGFVNKNRLLTVDFDIKIPSPLKISLRDRLFPEYSTLVGPATKFRHLLPRIHYNNRGLGCSLLGSASPRKEFDLRNEHRHSD